MKDQAQEAAGDNSEQYLAGRDLVVVRAGISYTEAKAIALEVFEKNAPRLTKDARALINERTEQLNDDIVQRIYERNPDDLNRFGDPRLLAPLVSAQRSFAETGREDLGAVLASLVADLAAEPTQNRREIVLRLAVECAPRLTRQQLNSLSVIFLLHRWLLFLAHFEGLTAGLDTVFRPYYGQMPSDAFDYSYMGSTEAGTFYGGLGVGPYKLLHKRYANVMYEPFRLGELPSEVLADKEKLNTVIAVIPEDHDKDDDADRSYRLKYESSETILIDEFKSIMEHSGFDKALRKFVVGRSMSVDDFKQRVLTEQPELHEFLNGVEETQALDFEVNPIGMMLARQEISTRNPEHAKKIDRLFEG